MIMKKITDLQFWEGILCTTEDEAKKICKLMNEAEIARRSNKKVSVEDTHRDDTRWHWITYFPKDWVYWTDNYEWKTSKYTIYPAVLFYLREKVEKDWIVDAWTSYIIKMDTQKWCSFEDFKEAIETHAPKQKKIWYLELWERYKKTAWWGAVCFLDICDFLQDHWLLLYDK